MKCHTPLFSSSSAPSYHGMTPAFGTRQPLCDMIVLPARWHPCMPIFRPVRAVQPHRAP